MLVFDDKFLLRQEVRACWDLVIYVRVDRNPAIARGVKRDSTGGEQQVTVRELYERRYTPAHDLYDASIGPLELSHIVIDNNDFDAPAVLRP